MCEGVEERWAGGEDCGSNQDQCEKHKVLFDTG